MILGLFAGDMIVRARDAVAAISVLIASGVVLIMTGWLAGRIGLCPVVKAIWTPSWVLFSGGWCFLLLAGFHALVEIARLGRVLVPLSLIGMNSITAYALSHLYPAFFFNSIRRVAGANTFLVFGQRYEPFVYGTVVLVVYWLILYVLYTRRVFIRL
jgi:predicted acyltransferase